MSTQKEEDINARHLEDARKTLRLLESPINNTSLKQSDFDKTVNWKRERLEALIKVLTQPTKPIEHFK